MESVLGIRARLRKRLGRVRPALLDAAGLLALAALMLNEPQARALAQGMLGQRPYLVVESGKRFARLQDAVNAIGEGEGTIRIAPGRWHDCAVQQRGAIGFVAAVPGKAVLDGRVCEAKGALVLRGRGARIAGLVFSGLHNAEGNGSGIRLERGNLAVTQAWFRASDEGILAGNDRAASVTIDKSTFTHLGRCDRGLDCAHSVYIGEYASVAVSRTRFEAGDGGHYLKSRSARISVTDCAFDDSRGRATNYMIDLPNGATGRIAGNWFLQGRDKDNASTFIAVSAEALEHSALGLTVTGNVAGFDPGLVRSSAFVADWSTDRLAVGGNRLARGIVAYERR